jgi:4-hydroxy-tetrahydrodipicolinate synthase
MTLELRGVFTALVTPMNKDGSVDFGALDALVDAQLAGGIKGLVPCGTTGEATTLNGAERAQVVSRVAKRAGGRVPVVAGTGSNSTAETIEHQKRAKDAGATHALVVTPYYNKPTPEGLFRHYTAVAESTDLPIIVYNVPSRTGCDVKPDTLARLAGIPRVVGVKEATADLDRVTLIRRTAPQGFALMSGDDASCCPFVLLGGDGVISVSSNLLPAEMVAMITAALEGKLDKARAGHHALRDINLGLFVESNPIPIKAAMAMKGMLKEHYRLPLCEIQPDNRKKLEAVLKGGGWL